MSTLIKPDVSATPAETPDQGASHDRVAVRDSAGAATLAGVSIVTAAAFLAPESVAAIAAGTTAAAGLLGFAWLKTIMSRK